MILFLKYNTLIKETKQETKILQRNTKTEPNHHKSITRTHVENIDTTGYPRTASYLYPPSLGAAACSRPVRSMYARDLRRKYYTAWSVTEQSSGFL